MATLDNASFAGSNGVYYLFNFANSSEFSFVTIESTHFQSTVHTVASASDGVFISFDNFASGSTIETGKFTLYGLKK